MIMFEFIICKFFVFIPIRDNNPKYAIIIAIIKIMLMLNINKLCAMHLFQLEIMTQNVLSLLHDIIKIKLMLNISKLCK